MAQERPGVPQMEGPQKPELPKHVESQMIKLCALDARHGAKGVDIYPARSDLISPIFPHYPAFPLLIWDC